MLLWGFNASSGVNVELPKYGLCYVDPSLLLDDATGGLTLRLILLRHLRACSRDSLHFRKYLYSMMIDCICPSHNIFLFCNYVL